MVLYLCWWSRIQDIGVYGSKSVFFFGENICWIVVFLAFKFQFCRWFFSNWKIGSWRIWNWNYFTSSLLLGTTQVLDIPVAWKWDEIDFWGRCDDQNLYLALFSILFLFSTFPFSPCSNKHCLSFKPSANFYGSLIEAVRFLMLALWWINFIISLVNFCFSVSVD